MKICTTEYNLECFKTKDIWTWKEIIEILEDYEQEIHYMQDQLDDLKQTREEDEHDKYMDSLLERGEL